MTLDELKVGYFYSNGAYGRTWGVRQLAEIVADAETGEAGGGALRVAVEEHARSNSGKEVTAASPRIESRRVAIRSCCHGRRRSQTAVGCMLGWPA